MPTPRSSPRPKRKVAAKRKPAARARIGDLTAAQETRMRARASNLTVAANAEGLKLSGAEFRAGQPYAEVGTDGSVVERPTVSVTWKVSDGSGSRRQIFNLAGRWMFIVTKAGGPCSMVGSSPLHSQVDCTFIVE